MLEKILSNTLRHKLDEFESIISGVIQHHAEVYYAKDMHSYIIANNELESQIQSTISLNKKFFNAVNHSRVHSLHLITEAWCMDACILLPLLRAIHIVRPDIAIWIYPRDQNEELMNRFLSNGSKSIPIVFGTDASLRELFRWGPRSQKARELLTPIQTLTYAEKAKVLREFYKLDSTKDIQSELLELF